MGQDARSAASRLLSTARIAPTGPHLEVHTAMAIGLVGTSPRRPPVPWKPLVIAEDRCKGCELCLGACPKALLELDRSRVNVLGYHPVRLLDPNSCTSCALCARICPDVVFTVWAAPRRAASRQEGDR